jgi:hypothetical protein
VSHHDDVVSTLEDDGVATFDAAWDVLADQLTGTLRADAPGRRRAPDRDRSPGRAEGRP